MSAPTERPTEAPVDFAEVLALLGYTADEFVSLIHWASDGAPHTAVLAPADAAATAAELPRTVNAFYGVSPTCGPARRDSGRGKAQDVTRLAALPADLDVKPGGCPTLDAARAVIAELAIAVGCTRPAVIVESGHGLHAYWPISNGQISDSDDTSAAQALLRRWGRLVAHIAAQHDAAADNVFDLPRVMRLPGSLNNKSTDNGAEPLPVIARRQPGSRPLTVAEVDRALTKLGIAELEDDRAAGGAAVSPPASWRFADATCGYVAKMLDGWDTDQPQPGGGRHPFVLSQHVRLACAHRLGCVTETDHARGRDALSQLLTRLVTTTTPRRPVGKFEAADMLRYGTDAAAAKTDAQARAELGDHDHGGDGPAVPRDEPIPGEAEFWDDPDYPQLTACRDYARSVRVGPWAMCGAALAVAAATIPPHVVLPAVVGDYASVNLYVNLCGESGSIKSGAVAAARAWLDADPAPEPVKPGSGQGVAKCFAYIKRTQTAEPIQVGKRWAALAVVSEVDTLTTAGGLSSSNLWAELRSAWSAERVGHDYADAGKTVVLQPHRFRLCMVVCVQPLRSRPLFDDADAGTPQRFVWLPVDDPDCPEQRPGAPERLQLQPWAPDPRYRDQSTWAGQLGTPVDREKLSVLVIPPEAAAAGDAGARGKLRNDPEQLLDRHRLLCRLKVAAALMRLCNRTEITSKDWEKAGVVMAVSDRTRERVQAQLAADTARRRLDAARVAGAARIIEARMATTSEAEDIERIAGVIIRALTAANDCTLSGAAIRRAVAGRDRLLVPKALEYLQDEGRVTVEAAEYRGQPGVQVTLLRDEEQTA